MCVLLSTYGLRGDVETDGGTRAVWLRALGAEAWVCAPPDFAELLAGVGVPLVPIGQPVHPPVTGALPPHAAELVAARFDTAAAAAEECECDAPAAASMMPTRGWR
jgi:vancomycin aglycone glucosyltransferase